MSGANDSNGGLEHMFDITTEEKIVTQVVIKKSSVFGVSVRNAREALGKSQEEISKAIGVERTAVTNWESGRATPPLPKFLKLCRALEVTPNDLLGF